MNNRPQTTSLTFFLGSSGILKGRTACAPDINWARKWRKVWFDRLGLGQVKRMADGPDVHEAEKMLHDV